MTIVPPTRSRQKRRIPLIWVVTWTYLALMLFLPIAALITRAISTTPAQFWEIATSKIALSAYDVTFITALGAALVNGIFGTLIAWVLVRYEFPGRKLIDAAVDLPFALPTAVAGITLATIYSTNGLIGSLLAPLGIKIAFTRVGVFIAMLFSSMPFVVRTLQPVLQELEPDVEEAARSLGASKLQTFWYVILPPLIPPILTGVALGFSRAVGEFGSVVIISSNLPFNDLIAPVLVFQRLEQFDYTGATVIGMVLLVISLLLLLTINFLQRWGQPHGS
jgi:sulfate transport system permease protein